MSDLIRERDDWTCVRCQRQFPDRKGRDVHCSHFYSRQYTSVRWHPDNLLTLCARCHDFVGKDHDEHVRLMLRVLGEVRYEELRTRKRQVYRYRKDDKKAMLSHYRDELFKLKKLREAGATGPLHVVAYD
ncbi:MAG TPA: hypothetical protein VF202_15895 [Trueperaceae bacterium]